MRPVYWISCCTIGLLLLGSWTSFRGSEEIIADAATVEQLLRTLGDHSLDAHKPDKSVAGTSIEYGAELILTGKSDGSGKAGKAKPLSKSYTCASCHNVRLEDSDPAVPSPSSRLYYAQQQGMRFLPASSFYGLVNRTSFFNDEYRLRFSNEQLGPAKRKIREAIRFCNAEFNKGREIEDWEMESMLAYLWTLELKSSDLFLSKEEMMMYHMGSRDPDKRIEALRSLKSKYLQAIPAHFSSHPEAPGTINPRKPRPEEGELIFRISCLHCHAEKKFSSIALDTSRQSRVAMMEKYFSTEKGKSLEKLIREGSDRGKGKKPYMPAYSIERLSKEQLNNLGLYLSGE